MKRPLALSYIIDICFLYDILLIRTRGRKKIMVTKTEKINPYSAKNIYRSIVSPSSSGEEAAKEHIENIRIKRMEDVRIKRMEDVRIIRAEILRYFQRSRRARNSGIHYKNQAGATFKAGKKKKEKVK